MVEKVPSLLPEAAVEEDKADEEAKSSEGEKPAEAESGFDPAKLTLPEGFEVDPEAMKSFGEIASKHKISQEAAQALLEQHSGVLKSVAAKPYQLWADTQKTWQQEIKADKELGGDNFPEVAATIAKGLDKFGDPEVRKALDYTGAGNNPAIFRTLYRMSKALSEGQTITGQAAPAAKPPVGASAMYPELPPQ